MRLLEIRPRLPVQALALAPSGRAFATAQPHHGVTVRDLADGRELARCPGNGVFEYNRLEYSPDGDYLAAAHPRGVDIVHAPTGRWVGRLRHLRHAADLRFLPGRAELAVATQCRCEVVRYAPRTAFAREFQPHPVRGWTDPARNPIALHPDATRAAFASPEGELSVGDVTGDEVPAFVYPRPGFADYRPVRTAATGSRFAVADPAAVRVFDWPAGRAARPVPAAAFPVTTPQPDPFVPPLALTPCGGSVLVRGERSRVELRSAATGELLGVWKWGLPRTLAIAVAPDGLLAAAAGTQGRVAVWDLG